MDSCSGNLAWRLVDRFHSEDIFVSRYTLDAVKPDNGRDRKMMKNPEKENTKHFLSFCRHPGDAGILRTLCIYLRIASCMHTPVSGRPRRRSCFVGKLEMLGSILSRLASPRKILGEKRGPATDGRHHRVTSRVAPGEHGATKNTQKASL